MKRAVALGFFAVGLSLVACKKKDSEKYREARGPGTQKGDESDDRAGGTGGRAMGGEGKMGRKDVKETEGQYAMAGNAAATPPMLDAPAPVVADKSPAKHKGKDDKKQEDRAKNGDGDDSEAAAPTRSWFPETFLFEPLIETNAQGTASLKVRVPDRLTTWRILALAHARNGAQAGAVASFLGTLPAYVDPIVPSVLLAGDEIRLPIQVVNTTDKPISGAFHMSADHGTLQAPGGTLTIPAQGSLTEYATLKTSAPGAIEITAGLGATDAVKKTVDVQPAGRPVTQAKAGTLAAVRSFDIAAPADADTASARVRLQVFPGALALLRSELSVAVNRGGVAEDAYALLLAGRATELLTMLGEKADPEAVRTLALLIGQRVIRYGRSPDVTVATLLAEAALAHPDRPVLARLGERMAQTLASQQRPDGSFGGATGWTLQRLFVTTADAVRAVSAANTTPAALQRAHAVRVRAMGMIERNFDHIEDPYTAAALLAAGLVEGAQADKLREKVLAAIKPRDDGSRWMMLEPGVVRADGLEPSLMEATALAVLALDGVKDAPLADLGATLLGSYSPGAGWGDGRVNLVCMQAVLKLFKDPLPKSVQFMLKMDDKVVAEGTLDAARLRDVVTEDVSAAGSAGAHHWELSATPPLPGLGYSLTLTSWVPWKAEKAQGGLELQLAAPDKAAVGLPSDVTVVAVAPSGTPLRIRESLPAGVQVDTASLTDLVSKGTITRFESEDGAVTLFVPALEPGRTFAAKYRVIPTLAGTLHSSASSIELVGRPETAFHVPPITWSVK